MSARLSSVREKVLVTAMVGVVSVFLIQRFVVAPYVFRLDELKTTAVRKERQLRRIQNVLASRQEIEAEYDRRFTTRPKARPAQGEMGPFLKSIETLARETNVHIRDIHPQAATDPTNKTTISALFVTESSWTALAGFLLKLEEDGVSVEKMTLTRSAQSSNEIKAQTQLTRPR